MTGLANASSFYSTRIKGSKGNVLLGIDWANNHVKDCTRYFCFHLEQYSPRVSFTLRCLQLFEIENLSDEKVFK